MDSTNISEKPGSSHETNYRMETITLSEIMAHPANPRGPVDPADAQEMKESLIAVGQKTEVRVRPLTEEEKAKFAPFEYLLLGGHVRLAGALLAGWETLRAVVLLKPMTEDEEELEVLMDNRWTDMSWWRWDLAIERRMNRNPYLSQRKLAIQLKMSNTKVYKAMKILGTLNPAAREVVSLNLASAVTPIGVESVNPVDTLVPAEGESVNWVDTLVPVEGESVNPVDTLVSAEGESVNWVDTQPSVFQITESILMALADLKDHQLVEKALNLVIERKMTESQTKKLVKWVLSGGDMTQFEAPAKAPKAKAIRSQKGEPGHPHSIPRTDGEGGAVDPDQLEGVGTTPVARVETQAPKPIQPHQASTLVPKAGYNFQKEFKAVTHWVEKTAKGTLKDILREIVKFFIHGWAKKIAHVVVPIKTSSHSGHGQGHHGSGQGANLILVFLHWTVYSLLQLTFWWVVLTSLVSWVNPGLRTWVEFPFRYLAYQMTVAGPARLWPLAKVHWGWALGLGALLIWGVVKAFAAQPVRMAILFALLGMLWVNGRGWGEYKLPSLFESKTESVPVASPPTVAEITTSPVVAPAKETKKRAVKPKTRPLSEAKESVAPPASTSAVKPSLEVKADPQYLEQEIIPILKNSRIKTAVVQVDADMGANMAGNRLGDLQMADKYSLKVGRDTVKVLTAFPSATNFNLTYQGNSPFGLLGGSEKISFYWEDVKGIHANEIETGNKTIYQLGFVVKDMKHPFVVQCSTQEDLDHLVSAFQYWIKAEAGKTVPVGGMPYLNQGLKLNEDGQVTLLWADSPADQAGLKLGDYVWNVGKYANEQSNHAALEAQLQSLAAGQYPLYIVTSADWIKARTDVSNGQVDEFNPVRHRKELVVP